MTSPDSTGSKLGGRIGGRIADLTAKAVLDAKVRAAPHFVRTAMTLQDEFFRLTGFEVAKTIGPLYQKVADHPETPEWMRRTGRFVAAGKGQWATLLASTATGALIGSGFQRLIDNELGPSFGAIIADSPHGRLTPADAAAAYARQIESRLDYAHEAAEAGIGPNRFEVLAQLHKTYPSLGDILDLWRRELIDEPMAHRWLNQVGIDDDTAARMLHLKRVYLTPADAAAMWNRDILSSEQGREIASRWGVPPEDFDRLAELGGEPLGPEALLTAFRRGIIDADRLQRGIVQGPVRKEWFDVIRDMQYAPMTITDALTAWAQGHIDDSTLARNANENGLRSEDLQPLMETSGTAPGIEFMLDALNRGEMTEPEVVAGIKESRPKNKYIPLIMRMRKRILPQETARVLYRKGVISKERIQAILTQHGFVPEDVAALIDGEAQEDSAAVKELTASQILELYQDRAIPADLVTEMLTALGYTEQSVTLQIELADLRRLQKFINAAITRLHGSYIARRMERDEATLALDALGIVPDQRNDILDLWDIERTTVTKGLTTAQIVAAAKLLYITVPEAGVRLEAQGYAPDDALLLLRLGKVPMGAPNA
jgi:hypothetical protein